MGEKMGTAFTDNDYLKGRVPMPPDVYRLLGTRPSAYPGELAVADGATENVDIYIEDGAAFLVEEIKILSSLHTSSQDKADVLITDSGSSRQWSNRPVPLRDMAGIGARQKFLTHPNILRPNSNVNVQITNNSGSDARFYIALVGRLLPGLSADRMAFMAKRHWYQYVLNVEELAASAVDAIYKVQIDTKADFMLHRILSSQLWTAVVGATAGAESAEVLWNLVNTSGDVPLFKEKVAARLTMGQAAGEYFNNAASFGPSDPFAFKQPWLARRGSILKGLFDNKSTDAIAAGFDVVLEGIKIFF